MSEFWSGALAAALGAVIGGGFTAWAARAQVKGAFAAALAQVERAHTLQTATLMEERRRFGRLAFHQLLVDVYHDLQTAIHPPCPHDRDQLGSDAGAIAAWAHGAVQRLFKADDLYRTYMTAQEAERLIAMLEPYAWADDRWQERLYRDSRKVPKSCLLHADMSRLSDTLYDYARGVADTL